MNLIPYVDSGGAYSLPDDVIKNIWRIMVHYNLDKAVFYSGGMDEGRFLKFLKNKGNVVHTIWEDDGISMIAWLNSFGANHAFAHFCCFPKTWGRNSVVLGRKSLKYWFDFKNDDGTPLLDVIMGFTPEYNKRAVSFVKKVGLTIMGTVPHIRCGNYGRGMVFSYITRGGFDG